jgi:preprotein translocase subunit SecA
MNKKFLYQIKTENNNLHHESDQELEKKIEKIKNRLIKEKDYLKKDFLLETIIPEWFALVQEISLRKIGLKHYDSQILAGLELHNGKIVEMKTGEGKTLASTFPVSLNALLGKGVHVVTVNEYLAERDQKWMGKIYNGLGLKAGLVKSTSSISEKKRNYFADITYVTNSEVVFDYLRDSSAYNFTDVVQRAFHYCVIDEIDSILIDEARTPLILSTVQGKKDINKLYLAKLIAKSLKKDFDFQVDEKKKDINLTETGYKNTIEKLGKKSLYDPDDPWILEILNALKGEYIFKKNKDYIVLNNKVLIVDEFTGRIMEDRRWSQGIHEAIETKEKVELGGGTQTKSSITYQNFFPLYPKLAGMTGTAKTAEKEFKDIYNLEVVVLTTFRPMIRKDLPDLVYQTELAKWKAVVKKAKECFLTGQPLLIGTASVEKSEILSELFTIGKIPHQVLNAKPENVRRESEVIAQAGERFAITIATNMAGRGTDIILGGNSLFKVKQKLTEIFLEKKISNTSFDEEQKKNENENFEWTTSLINQISEEYKNLHKDKLKTDILNLPYSLELCLPSLKSLYNYFYQKISLTWEKENSLIKSLGGLFVLGTERHETRRIDNQLRGRAGRQGDPGTSQFYVSLEDDLIKVFGGENLRNWVDYLLQDKDVPLESELLTKSLENAQKKVELYNADLRKNVFQYDDILNIQRKQLFTARKELLCENILQEFFLRYGESFLDEELLMISKEIFQKKEKNSIELQSEWEKWFDSYSSSFVFEKKKNFYPEIWISHDLKFADSNTYQESFLKNTRAVIVLSILDFYWTEHLERMSDIRDTITWRSYGQQNPLTEYNSEAFQSLKVMFDQIRFSMLYSFLNHPILK